MDIQSYEVLLKRLTQEDIELVRNWRNDPKISSFMSYRDHITQEMQQKWFDSINNGNNYYFVIHYNNKKVGLADLKKINKTENSAELGIFIYEDDYLNSMIPYKVMFSLTDFAFYELNLSYLEAYILKSNKRAIRFNMSYGFVLQPNQENENNQLYRLSKNTYELKCEKIKKILFNNRL